MFAGAAREAVFSKPEVIRRIQADFVPVALKAALVNSPPDDEEGRLYHEIGRSKVMPQGICVVNSAGKVLDWVAMFDDDKCVLAFLDHAHKRFGKFPDAKQPVPAERYMKYPSEKLADVADTGKALVIPDRHAKGQACPAKPLVQRGTVVARVFGRALDKDGKPLKDTIRQEHYVEDRFHVPVAMQEVLVRDLAAAGAKRSRISNELARLLVSHAYLGQLDVDPVGAPGGKGTLKQCEFWADKVAANRIRITGKSEAVGEGRMWYHEVQLTWRGLIDLQDKRITRLLLLAEGAEKLKWGDKQKGAPVDVAILPGGHPVDLACKVRYGLIGEPVPADEATDAPTVAVPGFIMVPDQAREQLVEALGPAFMIFQNKVQGDLKLSTAQKDKLRHRLSTTLQGTMQFFQTIQGLPADERERKHAAFRQKAQEELTAFLKQTLKPEHLKRLRQLELQREGPFALGQPEVAQQLQLTDHQKKQVMAVMQELHKAIQPLGRQAESGGDPEKIRPKVLKLRQDHAAKIEALLSESQKKQWQAMLGKRLD